MPKIPVLGSARNKIKSSYQNKRSEWSVSPKKPKAYRKSDPKKWKWFEKNANRIQSQKFSKTKNPISPYNRGSIGPIPVLINIEGEFSSATRNYDNMPINDSDLVERCFYVFHNMLPPGDEVPPPPSDDELAEEAEDLISQQRIVVAKKIEDLRDEAIEAVNRLKKESDELEEEAAEFLENAEQVESQASGMDQNSGRYQRLMEEARNLREMARRKRIASGQRKFKAEELVSETNREIFKEESALDNYATNVSRRLRRKQIIATERANERIKELQSKCLEELTPKANEFFFDDDKNDSYVVNGFSF